MDSLPISPENELAASPPTTRRGEWIFRLLMALLWTLAILMVCWLPRNLLQEVEDESAFLEIPNLDKIIHWGIFAGFALLWLRVGESRWRYAWVAVAGCALAAVTEIVQDLPIISRDGDLADFLIDLLGVVIGIAAARRLEPLLRRAESYCFAGIRRLSNPSGMSHCEEATGKACCTDDEGR